MWSYARSTPPASQPWRLGCSRECHWLGNFAILLVPERPPVATLEQRPSSHPPGICFKAPLRSHTPSPTAPTKAKTLEDFVPSKCTRGLTARGPSLPSRKRGGSVYPDSGFQWRSPDGKCLLYMYFRRARSRAWGNKCWLAIIRRR